ncbi:MAG: hypothetical protein ACYDBJ_07190 [Aggregatilineales bacterium]
MITPTAVYLKRGRNREESQVPERTVGIINVNEKRGQFDQIGLTPARPSTKTTAAGSNTDISAPSTQIGAL